MIIFLQELTFHTKLLNLSLLFFYLIQTQIMALWDSYVFLITKCI